MVEVSVSEQMFCPTPTKEPSTNLSFSKSIILFPAGIGTIKSLKKASKIESLPLLPSPTKNTNCCTNGAYSK